MDASDEPARRTAVDDRDVRSVDGPPPLLRVRAVGPPRAAGRAYGEAAAPLIRRHLDLALAHLRAAGVAEGAATERATAYRAATAAARPELADEVDGVAEGAGIARELAWVLQLRAELTRPRGRDGAECSSLAVRDRHGAILAGQNVDLPTGYRDVLVLLEREPPGLPRVVTLTPAGQIGQNGMNADGVTLFANFLHVPGWRVGVPRYLLTRVALAERTRAAAVAAVAATPRAASRNLLIADPDGAVNVETAPAAIATAELRERPLLHTNHVLSERLAGQERAPAPLLANSRARLARLRALTDGVPLDRDALMAILRDRRGAPDALCHLPGDSEEDWATVASVIAEPAARRLHIAVGAPSRRPYVEVQVA